MVASGPHCPSSLSDLKVQDVAGPLAGPLAWPRYSLEVPRAAPSSRDLDPASSLVLAMCLFALDQQTLPAVSLSK